MNTRTLNPAKIFAAIVIVLGTILFLILKPIIVSDPNDNVRVTQVDDGLPGREPLPKTYADIKPEIPPPPPPAPEPVGLEVEKPLPIKPSREVVIVEPPKREPTEREKAIAKARTLHPSFDGLNFQDSKSQNHNLNVSLQKPGTEYIITTGTVISAITVTGINSDLPGHVIARIDRDIKDSISGNHLLLPQSSQLIGVYNSHVKMNQKRVQVTWKEIKLPDGSTVNLEKGMPAVDQQGMAGAAQGVIIDHHYFPIAFSIVAVSLMNTTSNQISKTNDSSLKDELSGDVAEDMADAGSDIFEKKAMLKPSIQLPIGSTIKMLITKDLIFEEPYDAKPF